MNKTTKWYAGPLYAFMVLALVAGLTLVPVASPIVEASSVSNVTAALSNTTPNTATNYTINFTTNVKLTTAASDTITVEFPAGTTSNTTISGLTTSYVTVNGTAPSSVSTGGRRVSVTPGADVNAGNVIVVFSGNKITNPRPEGSYTLKVYTSQEPTAVTSSSYIIDEIIGMCNVTNTPTRVNTTALYHLNATVPTQLLQGDTITITFPATTYVPTSITSTSYVDINGTNLDATSDYSVSNKTVTLSVPDTVNAGFMLINFTTGVGLKNPTPIRSNWTLNICTSKDRGVKRSETYSTTAGTESVITQTVWSSYDAYLPNNTCSSAFKIRTLDANGANATVTGDVTFNLDGDSGGKFYDSTACDNQIITTTIAGGASQSDAFYYKNTQPGTRDVTAVDVNGTWTQANQSIIVNPMLQLWGGGSKVASYSTFGEAVAAALPYDIIKVSASTYGVSSTITIDTAHLTIESTSGAASTIVDGSAVSNYIFTIAANNVTLGGNGTGLTINGTVGTTTAIYISKAGGISDVTIQNNTLTNNNRGIYVDADNPSMNTTNLTIKGNTITVSRTSTWTEGIVFNEGDTKPDLLSNSLITENTISNYSEAVTLYAVNNTVISNNTISDSRFTGIAIDRRNGTATNNVTISGNTVTNVTGSTQQAGIAVDKRGSGYGCSANVTNITITENTVTGCKMNIALKRFSDDTHINAADMSTITVLHNNIASGTQYGVYNGHTATLNATYNWWGNASGPGGVGPGTGDNVSTHVTYSPWLTEPYPDGNTTAFSSITLKTNWNFISVPRKMANATFGFLLSGINFSTAWGYNASTATWVNLTSSSAVEVLSGYWIDSNEAATINLTFVSTGQEVPASKNLTGNKWNAIGFSNLTAIPANATLKSVEGSWSTAMGWDATNQCYDDSIIYEMNDNTTMDPGKGYWLWMTANDTLAALSA
jgi:hypothetical protein